MTTASQIQDRYFVERNDGEQSSVVAAALDYASRGCRVIPLHHVKQTDRGASVCSCWKGLACQRAGRHPLFKAWQNIATTNEYLIQRWWKAWPFANLGVLIGLPERITAVNA